jgi:fimbrial chaperone protein
MIPRMHRTAKVRTGQALSSPFFFALTAALLSLAAGPAFAFTFDPIVQDFTSTGQGSVQSFRLANPGTETIAVRISMLTRRMDLDGKESNAPADQLFIVFPSRVTLEANAEQAVKIQWKGPAGTDVEQCFRILVEQLPVDFGGGQTQQGTIKVMFRYLGAAYILPKNVKPDVVLDSSRVAADPNGRQALELVFSNRGNAHTILGDLRITVTAKNAVPTLKRVFGPDELAGINGENILPGAKRRFWLPLPADMPRDGLDVAFLFEAIR